MLKNRIVVVLYDVREYNCIGVIVVKNRTVVAL